MTNKELNVGDSIWEKMSYADFGYDVGVKRYLDRYTIKAITKATYILRGVDWKVQKRDMGTKFFASKLEALKDALIENEQGLEEEMERNIRPLQKEINRLKRAIEREKGAVLEK